jgi:UPF0716 protein FxsA
MWLFVLFVAVPLIEIALFIQVGGLIGLWPTLAIVVITALLGTHLVRSQGAAALGQLRSSFNELRDPSEPLAHGAMILFAGALLLTPGFFTDAVGFSLLVPGVRRALMRWGRRHIAVRKFQYGQAPGGPQAQPRPRGGNGGPRSPAGASRPRPGEVIEGEFEEVDPDNRTTHRPSGSPSGWTRH